jgi:hypothetical protein
MLLFVLRVTQIQPPEKRIMRTFGGAREIAPAIGLGFRKSQQPSGTAAAIAPDPSLEEADQSGSSVIAMMEYSTPVNASLFRRLRHAQVAVIRMKIAATLLGAAGLACILTAAMVPDSWVAHHFLPDFAISPFGRFLREVLERAALALAGALLVKTAIVLVRLTPAARRAKLGAFARIAVAAALGVGAGEALLPYAYPRVFEALTAGAEPLRFPDPMLGWVNAPARTAEVTVADRTIVYAIDPDGNRIGSSSHPEPDAPAIVFSGESYIFGYKLPWDETVPARVGAHLAVPVINLAVAAYSNAQAYLRLKQMLPRIKHPTAVVSIFLPLTFRKDLDHSRPWLDASLTWHPAETRFRIALLARWLFPYTSASDVAQGAASVRAMLHASAELAQARGARHVIVVPRTVPEPPEERIVRETVLDQAGINYLLVDLDPAWHIPDDRHPDARGAEAIAERISAALRNPPVAAPAH